MCRRIPDADPAVCPSVDGRRISAEAMDEFESSWLGRAVRLQSTLDLDVPMTAALVPHTHNSANSTASQPTLSSTDANQVLSLTDQLRIGIRGIEIDVHWAPNPEGAPADGFNAGFERGDRWNESGSTTDFDCATDRAAVDYGTTFVRRYEDSTWLSAMAGGGSRISREGMAEMVACGVNLPGFDQLHPGDPRIASLVWSWAPGQPAADARGRCASQGPDARWSAGNCGTARPVACRTPTRGWAVTAAAVPWARSGTACRSIGAVPGVPANGPDNLRLRKAAGARRVWLAHRQGAHGTWGTDAVG